MDHVARFLLSKKHFGRVGDFEWFRWVPEPVRLILRVVSYQMQLLGTGSQFVGPESRFYVLERQGTQLMHVQQNSEFFLSFHTSSDAFPSKTSVGVRFLMHIAALKASAHSRSGR